MVRERESAQYGSDIPRYVLPEQALAGFFFWHLAAALCASELVTYQVTLPV